ncbi:MAG: phosphoribosyltransferase [Candidatus Aenigmarchaeota archaeon]|nr:phosphoribosyltransferase [Candidatus Aenigmarchaeota archaeon]
MENFECWMPNWDYVSKACKKAVREMKQQNFKPDIVIALSRGGYVPARNVCDMLIIKDLVSMKVDHWGITASKDGEAKIRYPISFDLTGKKVLIVDDITDSGESMKVSMDFIRSLNPLELKSMAVFHMKESKFLPDFFGEEIDWKWVIFPWNYVEDMCNIIPKVLDTERPKNIKKIQIDLKENFKVDIYVEEIAEILDELNEAGKVLEKRLGWVKL